MDEITKANIEKDQVYRNVEILCKFDEYLSDNMFSGALRIPIGQPICIINCRECDELSNLSDDELLFVANKASLVIEFSSWLEENGMSLDVSVSNGIITYSAKGSD